MNVQIYAHKRDFEVQKAERYFKERRIAYHFIDLTRHKLGQKELTVFARQAGLKNIIDTDSKLYKGHYIANLTLESTIFEALMQTPRLLRCPIVRNGQSATVGYKPDVWAGWE